MNPAAPELPGAGVGRAWDRFFFTPADPRPLALVRVCIGAVLVWSWIWLGFDLDAALGPHAWVSRTLAETGLERSPGAWSLWTCIPDTLMWPAWALGLVAMICLTLGLGSPVAAVLSWVFLLSAMRRAPVILHGFELVTVTWLLYLAACGASGKAWSLDRWIARRWRGVKDDSPHLSVAANVGLRLIQMHLCLIYASAGLAKLQGTPWWDGTAVGMLLGNSEFRPFDLSFLAEHPRLLELATHITIGFEILYPILIWHRAWRPWLLGLALMLHLGIAVSMGLAEFALAMLAGNLAFVPPEWLSGRFFGGSRIAVAGVQSSGTVAGVTSASSDPRSVALKKRHQR